MQRKTRYFSRDGDEVSAQQALRGGILQNGYSVRVPTFFKDARQRFRDGRALFDSGQVAVTDGDGTLRTANRPGFRVADSPLNRQAIADARTAYLNDLQSAWRRDAGGDRTECPACEGSGFDANGKACPRCGGSGEIDDVDEEAEAQSDAKRRRRRPEPDDDDDVPFGSQDSQDRRMRRTVDEMQVRRERILKPIYDSWVTELANSWRGNK